MLENISERHIEQKRKFIDTTYNIIKNEDISNVSIRRVAKEMGCSTALLYKYFEDLDHLLTFASIKALKNYIQDLMKIYNDVNNSLKLYVKLWESFAYHSFSNVKIFDNVFFGKHSVNLDNIFKEYYMLFYEEIEDVDEYLKMLITSGDFKKRNQIVLKLSIEKGYLKEKQAYYLDIICNHTYLGMMKEIIDDNNFEMAAMNSKALSQEYVSIVKEVIRLYLKENKICLFTEI